MAVGNPGDEPDKVLARLGSVELAGFSMSETIAAYARHWRRIRRNGHCGSRKVTRSEADRRRLAHQPNSSAGVSPYRRRPARENIFMRRADSDRYPRDSSNSAS